MVTSSGVDVGMSSGSVETTIADSDADQMVIPGADVRRRVYSPGIDDETAAVRLRSSSEGDGDVVMTTSTRWREALL
jgi:hypothetical protein